MDDHPANLLALRALLEDPGYHLVEVLSGKEAIDRVQADDFAVILLDVIMPGMSGFETAQLAIWRVGLGRPSSPYGKRVLVGPDRHVASGSWTAQVRSDFLWVIQTVG